MWVTLFFVCVMALVSWLGKKWMGTENLTSRDGYYLGGEAFPPLSLQVH